MISDRRIRTSLIAILTDALLAGGKGLLAWLTGSAALLADAYHSASDLVISVMLLLSLLIRFRQEKKQDARAIDKARKFEALLAIVVSMLIMGAAVEIVLQIQGQTIQDISHLWLGIVGTLAIVVILVVISRLKMHVGRETDSPALEADGYHSQIDVFTSLAVLVSLIGVMVGIYLDTVVAIIIAVLIAVSGLELMLSGVRSLLKGGAFEQLSIWSRIAELVSNNQGASALIVRGRNGIDWIGQRPMKLVLGILTVYLMTGFTQVPLGYSGLHVRFSQVVETGLKPGLYYVLPWPMAELVRMPENEVRSVNIGSTVASNDEDLSASLLWRHIPITRSHEDEAFYLATADENLVEIQVNLQYRVLNQAEVLQGIAGVDESIQRFLQSVLWQEVAGRSFRQLISRGRADLSDSMETALVAELRKIGIDLQVVRLTVLNLQPPATVVSAYRQVLNAHQEKLQRINRAEADRLTDLPLANAERIEQKARVEGAAIERVLKAEGDGVRMSLSAEVYQSHPEAYTFNRYMDVVSQTLAGRSLILADNNIDTPQWWMLQDGAQVNALNGRP